MRGLRCHCRKSERAVPAHNDLFEAQSWIDRASKRLLLTVIYTGTVVVSAITVMATSKFEKCGAAP